MRATDAYAELLRLDRKVVTTGEAAARWRAERRTTAKRLKRLEQAGLISRLRRGLWSLEADLDPFVLPPFLTAPLPAYVSFWSALAHHQMIEQLPRLVWVASPARPRRIDTSIAGYEIHHLAPELFGGFAGSVDRGFVAEPAKALFDTVYVRAAAGSRAYFPELSPPAGFERADVELWLEEDRQPATANAGLTAPARSAHPARSCLNDRLRRRG